MMSLEHFKNSKIEWDTVNKDFDQSIQVVSGDVNSRTVTIVITDNGEPINLTGYSVKLVYKYIYNDISGFVMLEPTDPQIGKFSLTIPTEMTSPGSIKSNLILLNENLEQVIVSKNLKFISDDSTVTDLAQEVNSKIDDFTKLLLENMPKVMRSELNSLHAQTESNTSNIDLKANLSDMTSLQSAMSSLQNKVEAFGITPDNLITIKSLSDEIMGILSDLSQKGIDISDLNLRIGNINAELIASRNGKPNLKTRIDDLENETTAQLAENKNRIDEVASTGTTTSVIQNKISEMAQNGTISFNTVNNEMTTFMKKNNLFNPDIALVDKIPKWVGYNSDLTSDTNVTSATNFITSNVVQCNEGEVYIYEGGHFGSNIYYADSTKTLKQTTEVDNKTPFTIPSGIKYFRVLFTYNDSDYNNNQWKEKNKIVKGNSLENISPYGKNEVKDLILPNEIVKEPNLSQTLKDKINGINSGNSENRTLLIPKNTSYSEGEAILLLNFDGWTQNTFNVMAPYLKEKGIPFTLFYTGYDRETGINPNDLRNYAKEMGKNFEMAMYTGHPSSTMWGTTNFKEQLAQIKASYDGIVNYGLPKPKVCSYSGGVKSELTEYLCQNVFGQKIGRTTENSHIVNPVTTAFSIPCSGYGDDGYWPIKTVDSTVANKQHIAVMTHNILNGTDITDPSYNMRESYLKAWIDKIALELSNGTLKCMTFYEYYLYTILPHTSSIGQHALVWENDNRQHEYIYTENGWIELTNFQSYK